MGTVAVIDYGMGNLRSVVKAIEHVSTDSVFLTSSPHVILNAGRVVFPGQGSIRDCMSSIKLMGLDDAIRRSIETKPFLGICLGLQALFESSQENGGIDSLSVIPGRVLRFSDLKVPHLGWNRVRAIQHTLWNGIADQSRFYFVHSYYAKPCPQTIGCTDYGVSFSSAIAFGNVFATQFHPEKSAADGLQLLRNFMSWDGG